MIETTGTITVAASARAVLEFVSDLHSYREADHKIISVIDAGELGDGDHATVRYRGRLRGLVSPTDSNEVTLTRWSRVDFVGSPDSWVRKLVDFHGWFTCVETADGTVVSHGERFDFHRPARWVIDPYLRAWLARDIADEMTRLATILDHAANR